tara:strand:+ start:1105 stop:1323 length:219 start_codon:yes stop_codon:yes gene_type:complete
MSPMKRARQERAIKLHERTIASHEKSQELTTQILEDKKLTKKFTSDQVEKLRQKKLDRARVSLENTKKNLKG